MADNKEDALSKRDFSRVILTLENVLIPEEKLSPSPSVQDGLDMDTETDLRILGCELIQTSGILLKLPQVAMATGQVLFQRFYYSKSFVNCEAQHGVAMACINLASKIEEAPRRIRDVINVFHHIKQVKNGKCLEDLRKNNPLVSEKCISGEEPMDKGEKCPLQQHQRKSLVLFTEDKPSHVDKWVFVLNLAKTITPLILDGNYIALKNQVIKSERRVLKELGFCVHVKHPHKIIVMFLQVLDSHENAKLVQCAWNYMNDSFRTNVFVQYHPETIACACIYLAARQLQVPLPNNPPWFNIFDVTEEEINDICLGILKLYARPKPNPDKLEALVNSTKKIHIEAKLKAKGLSSAGATPNSGSRPETPVKLGTSPLTLPNLKKIKSEDDKGSDSSTGREYGNHVSKRRRSRSRSHSHSRSASRSRSPSPRRSKSRSYSSRSRSRSASRSPVEKRKYRDAESPPRKWKKNSHIKEYRDTYKDYKEDYYGNSKEKSRSRKHRRSTSYSPSRSRSYSRSPLPRKTHKKHVKERYRSRSRTPDRYSKVDKYDRSRSRDRLMRAKKRNGHHKSRSRERYRR